MKYKLTKPQHALLVEAMQRYELWQRDIPLTLAWTGLGTKTTYKPVLDGGYMEYAHRPIPRATRWFRLTERGAEIVGWWMSHARDCPQAQTMTSKKLQDNIGGGLWAYYGDPGDDYVASVNESPEAYTIAYHHGELPAFSQKTVDTLEELEVEMRRVQPDLRKWRKY